ncbi:MAG: hypothetical protein ACOH5I_24100 [Oligoflexus sp.]
MKFNFIYVVVALIWSSLLSSRIIADSITPPVYHWQDKGSESAGVYVRGPVLWQSSPCNELADSTERREVHFPAFKYMQLIKKQLHLYEGYYCWNMEIPNQYIGELIHISLIRIYGITSLKINDELVWQQNHQPESSEALDLFYQVKQPIQHVEFHLKCGESPLCGFRGTFKARSALEGSFSNQRSRSLDFFALAGLAFCFAFHQVFAFLRRRYNAATMIAMMAFALCLRIILTGQGQLHHYITLSESVYWRLEVFAVILLIPSTISMSRAIFPLDASLRLERYSWILSGLALPALIFANSSFFIPLMLITYILICFSIAAFFLIIKRGFQNRRTSIITFSVTVIIILTSTFLEVLNARINIELIPGLHPLGFLTSSLIVSVLFASRISEAFTQAERQESEIKSMTRKLHEDITLFDQRIEERTKELRLLIESLPTGIILLNRDSNNDWQVNGAYSRFLRDTMGMSVNDWPSFYTLIKRLNPDSILQDADALRFVFHTFENKNHFILHELQQLVPERSQWKKQDHNPDTQESLHLRLIWVPIHNKQELIGVYLFITDITQLITLEKSAKKVEVELGAINELMQLQLEEAENLQQTIQNLDEPKLSELTERYYLPVLKSILTSHDHQSFPHYQQVLSLLMRSYFTRNEELSFNLKLFLQHPIWQKYLSLEDLQQLQKLGAQ